MDKLYPPSIDGTIPAFYSDDGTTAEIVVPFTMNRSVSFNDIKGFCLKIKTIQTNTELEILKTTDYSDNKAHFSITDSHTLLSKIHVGQFLKVQLAYLYGDGENIENWDEGYYSTVSIIKYTSKPIIKINEFTDWDTNHICLSWKEIENFYNENYQASFEMSEMPVFSSLSGTYLFTNSLEIDKTEKPFQQKFSLYKVDDEYEKYELIETSEWFLYDLNNPNNNIYNFTTLIEDESNTDYIIQYSIQTINNIIANIFYIGYYDPFPIHASSLFNVNNNFNNSYIELSFSTDVSTLNNLNIDQIKIYRKENNANNWQLIKIISNISNLINFNFKDFCIEQGDTYQYCCLFFDKNNNISKIVSKEINVDFEDCFLYDGKRQLKIKFNPKISSFKTNRLEQKLETIGSRYPFVFRNNTVEYKEFPISGLISYHMDNNEEFIKKDELGIISSNSLKRTSNPEQQTLNNIETLDLIDYNIKAERLFKLKILDWLGNGEIKLFKSPTEGNYLVRLMNISLSPEDKLNRMIHSFSCIAYEVQECNYENLIKLIN